ncbi:laccase-19 isoform X2 [Aegilops tauschii subsp. strangulata]|uniref:Laccase n=1 Tax=Aegilops tauschii subsp. strangulata TaxID=200361 RepID=A0A453PZT7_AEGTS|nr:laccase-19 isoform X2 [Aegilops tauschii subsp. strangulata]
MHERERAGGSVLLTWGGGHCCALAGADPAAQGAVVFFAVALSAATSGDTAVVEHTFIVSQVRMRHLCNDTLVTVVNGQFPGPALEATEGDTVVVHLVNQSPYGITIHWHGVKQRLTCWADGAGMITQCPIQPNTTFTYRFDVSGQEGTLWWHSHVSALRATLHGIIVIRPRSGTYPFPKPDVEVPVIIGEWWQRDLIKVDKNFSIGGSFDDNPAAATINGKLGDLYNCSGVAEDNFVLDVEPGKTYLLRLVNAALFSEYYFKVAGHKLTVVGADASYLRPFTTEVVAVAAGETIDVLMVADAPPCRYYMAALANQPPVPDPQIPVFISRGVVQYNNIPSDAQNCTEKSPLMPEMPDQHDTITTFYFHGNLTGLQQPGGGHPLLPQVRGRVDERLFLTLGKGSMCTHNKTSCKRGGSNESFEVAYINNVSFHLPETTAVLEARYYGSGVAVEQLPSMPPRAFNFTDTALIPVVPGGKMEELEPTRKATTTRRFAHNATVEVVFQSTATMQSDSNPMHLHGHDFFVLAQGHGNYDAGRDVRSYNLVDPPMKNTVQVPRLGWAAIRFVADNPGAWFLHCHFEFHIAMGMATVFEVDSGPTLETTLPPPPSDLPKCTR